MPPLWRAVEEGLLVDFLRLMGVADEDDVDALVAPLQEQMQQHEEALGEVLLALAHRAGDVHQAEHHRLGVGHRLLLEAVEADVDRIDIGDHLRRLRSQPLHFALAARPLRCLASGLGGRASSAAISCRIAVDLLALGPRCSAMRRP